MRRPASASSRRIFSARSSGGERGAMAASAPTSARARGLASGAEAGKELEHGAVEGFGLIPVGEAVDPQAVGRRDVRHAGLPIGACAGAPGGAGPWDRETPL